jgi:bacteriocin biosynthesis cyclodehydratase domain-containing protein
MLELEHEQLVDHHLLLPPLLVSELAVSVPIPPRPALAGWYRVARDADRILFEHGGSVVTLEGRAASSLVPALVPLLDGSRTVEEIIEALGAKVAPATTQALELLAQNGLLLDGVQPAPLSSANGETATFVAESGRQTTPAAALARLASSDVAVAGGAAIGEVVARQLEDAGLARVPLLPLERGDAGNDLLVVVPEPQEVGGLVDLNEQRLALSRPWLQVLPHDGRVFTVGPLFVPGASACYRCYRLRRGACSGFEADFELIEQEPSRAASPPPLAVVAAGLAATISLRWLGAGDATLPGRFYTFETGVILGLGYHQLLRVPRCPTCGSGHGPMPSPWFKEAPRDG